MPEHLLFLAGRLAEKSLHRVLESMQPASFSHVVHVLSIQVAGLMTSDMIRRRLRLERELRRDSDRFASFLPLEHRVRRYCGDLANGGTGEILVLVRPPKADKP